jgi:hypothetical protein
MLNNKTINPIPQQLMTGGVNQSRDGVRRTVTKQTDESNRFLFLLHLPNELNLYQSSIWLEAVRTSKQRRNSNQNKLETK